MREVIAHYMQTPEVLRREIEEQFRRYNAAFDPGVGLYYMALEMRPCQSDACCTEVIFR